MICWQHGCRNRNWFSLQINRHQVNVTTIQTFLILCDFHLPHSDMHRQQGKLAQVCIQAHSFYFSQLSTFAFLSSSLICVVFFPILVLEPLSPGEMSHYQKLLYFVFEAIVITSLTRKHPTQLLPLRQPLLPQVLRLLNTRPGIIKRFGEGLGYVFSRKWDPYIILPRVITLIQFGMLFYL